MNRIDTNTVGSRIGGLLSAVALALALGNPALAEEEHGGGHDGHEAHHTIGLFIGETTEDTREERRDGTTLGLEYEYRFSPLFGIGATLERVFGDFDEDLLIVPFALHQGPWKFYAGPGIEYADGDTEPLLRVGIEYGFHVGGMEVSPQVDIDFIDDEEVFVIGVVIAREF